MNKKFFAIMIAFSISATPACAVEASSLISGYLGGISTVLFYAGIKKIKEAKSYLKVSGANPTKVTPGEAISIESPMVMHDWTTDYIEGGSLISGGVLALILAGLMLRAS